MQPEVNLEVAMKIANKMLKPWQYTTGILSLVVAGLLYIIIDANITADSYVHAENLTASDLISNTTIDKK